MAAGEGWSRAGAITFALCALAGGSDSFDTQMVGFTGRLIAGDMGFAVGRLGWMFGAGQLGGVIGAFVFGTLADRFGRARMLIASCALAAACTAAVLAAHGLAALLLCRFVTGVGLGGAMPCFLGLGVEAMPVRLRAALTPMLYASFSAGGVLGAWISAPLIAVHGWRGVFVLAAGLLALTAALLLVLPVVKPPGAGGGIDGGFQRGAESRAGRVAGLFADGLGAVTLPLWALFLLAPAGIFLLALWVPPLLQLLGVPAGATSLLLACLNAGALGVALGGGWVMRRVGRLRLLAPTLLTGALAFSAIAVLYPHFGALVVITTVAGAALGGSMALIVAVAATVYPGELRATGLGWALGVARIGQMSAPVAIGLVVGAGIGPRLALAACGVPTLLSLLPLVLLDRGIRRRAPIEERNGADQADR